MIEVLLSRLAAYHPETHGHSVRCGPMLARFAELNSEPDLLLDEYKKAGKLHDIGKLKVPKQILDKPTKLTALEMGIMENHPQQSYRIIQRHFPALPKQGIILQVALSHHEYFARNHENKLGYPHQISGDAIPREARMMAVIDVWDALTHARAYRKAWTAQQAETELDRLAGNKLDPVLTNMFLKARSNNNFADVEVIENSVPATK